MKQLKLWLRRLRQPALAGPSIADALRVSRQLRAKGVHTVVQRAGSHYQDVSSVAAAVEDYLALLAAGEEIQIRLSALGLDFSIALLAGELHKLTAQCTNGRTLWIELEDEADRDIATEMIRRVRQTSPNISLARDGVTVVRYGVE